MRLSHPPAPLRRAGAGRAEGPVPPLGLRLPGTFGAAPGLGSAGPGGFPEGAAGPGRAGAVSGGTEGGFWGGGGGATGARRSAEAGAGGSPAPSSCGSFANCKEALAELVNPPLPSQRPSSAALTVQRYNNDGWLRLAFELAGELPVPTTRFRLRSSESGARRRGGRGGRALGEGETPESPSPSSTNEGIYSFMRPLGSLD